MSATQSIDVGTLKWVRKEIEASLKRARGSLELYISKPDGQDAISDCVAALHEVHGALRMLDIAGAVGLAAETEALARALAAGRLRSRDAGVEALMQAILQLPSYLVRLEQGHADVPLALLPLINHLRGLRGKPLLKADAREGGAMSLRDESTPGGDARGVARTVRQRYQTSLLKIMRDSDVESNLWELADVLTALEDASTSPRGQRLWRLTNALVEALIDGGVDLDVECKRMLGQVDREVKRLVEGGEGAIAEELPQSLLDSLHGKVTASTSSGQRVSEIKGRAATEDETSGDEELEMMGARQSLAGVNSQLLETVGAAVRDDLARIKDGLDLFVRSEDRRVASLEKLLDPLRKVMDTLAMLGWEVPRAILQEKRAVIDGIISGKIHPTDSGLMELASALLYVESTLTTLAEQDALDDDSGDEVISGLQRVREGEDDDVEFAGRSTLSGAEYRQVVNAVIHEAKTDMAKAKEAIVTYMESPGTPVVLEGVPALFGHVAGGLVMLGMARATEYLNAVKRYISVNLVAQGNVPGPEELEHLADAISAIEYHLEAVEENRLGREEILDMAEKSLTALGYPWPVQPSSVESAVAEHEESAGTPVPVDDPIANEPVLETMATVDVGVSHAEPIPVPDEESPQFDSASTIDTQAAGDTLSAGEDGGAVHDVDIGPDTGVPEDVGLDLDWDDIGTLSAPGVEASADDSEISAFAADNDSDALSFEDQEPLVADSGELDIELDEQDLAAVSPSGYGADAVDSKQAGGSDTPAAHEDDLLGTVAFDVSDLDLPSPDEATEELTDIHDVGEGSSGDAPMGDEPAEDGTEVLDIADFDLGGDSSIDLDEMNLDTLRETESTGLEDFADLTSLADEPEPGGVLAAPEDGTDNALPGGASDGISDQVTEEISLQASAQEGTDLELGDGFWEGAPENLHELDIGDLEFDLGDSDEDAPEMEISGFSALDPDAEVTGDEALAEVPSEGDDGGLQVPEELDATILMSGDELDAIVRGDSGDNSADQSLDRAAPSGTGSDVVDESAEESGKAVLSAADGQEADARVDDDLMAVGEAVDNDFDALPLLDSGEPEPLPEDLILEVGDSPDSAPLVVSDALADAEGFDASAVPDPLEADGSFDFEMPDLTAGAPDTLPSDILIAESEPPLEAPSFDGLPELDAGEAPDIPHDIIASDEPAATAAESGTEPTAQEVQPEDEHEVHSDGADDDLITLDGLDLAGDAGAGDGAGLDLDLPDLQTGSPGELPDDLLIMEPEAEVPTDQLPRPVVDGDESAIEGPNEGETRMPLSLGGLGQLEGGTVTLDPADDGTLVARGAVPDSQTTSTKNSETGSRSADGAPDQVTAGATDSGEPLFDDDFLTAANALAEEDRESFSADPGQSVDGVEPRIESAHDAVSESAHEELEQPGAEASVGDEDFFDSLTPTDLDVPPGDEGQLPLDEMGASAAEVGPSTPFADEGESIPGEVPAVMSSEPAPEERRFTVEEVSLEEIPGLISSGEVDPADPSTSGRFQDLGAQLSAIAAELAAMDEGSAPGASDLPGTPAPVVVDSEQPPQVEAPSFSSEPPYEHVGQRNEPDSHSSDLDSTVDLDEEVSGFALDQEDSSGEMVLEMEPSGESGAGSEEVGFDDVFANAADPGEFLPDEDIDLTGDMPDAPLPIDESLGDLAEAETPRQTHVQMPAATEALVSPVADDIDDEILEIFLEEAEEELATMAEQIPLMVQDRTNADALSTVRRSFHTLKGSGRLVGARLLGEFAWSHEHLLNCVLEEAIPLSDQVLELLERARTEALPDLIEQLRSGVDPVADINGLMLCADALSRGESPPDLPEPEEASSTTLAESGQGAVVSPGLGDDADIDESELDVEAILAAEMDQLDRLAGVEPAAEKPGEADQDVSALRLDPVLYEIFSKETQGHVEVLREFVDQAHVTGDGRVTEELIRALHTLHGSSHMAGVVEVADLSGTMERFAKELNVKQHTLDRGDIDLLAETADAIDDIQRNLNTPGVDLPDVDALVGQISQRYNEFKSNDPTDPRDPVASAAFAARDQKPAAQTPAAAVETDYSSDVQEEDDGGIGELDPELLEIFLQEAEEILDEAETGLDDWRKAPRDHGVVALLQRGLHTLKGGARMAGISPVARLSHKLEDVFTRVAEDQMDPTPGLMDVVQLSFDRLVEMLESVGDGSALPDVTEYEHDLDVFLDPGAFSSQAPETTATALDETNSTRAPDLEAGAPEVSDDAVPNPEDIVSEPGATGEVLEQDGEEVGPSGSAQRQDVLRVEAGLLGHMVNLSGEVSIYRSRLEQQLGAFHFNLRELDGTVSRLKEQLRILDIETEAQMLARYDREPTQSPEGEDFDPLELDRFSQMQELSRSLVESVNDVLSLKGILESNTRESETLLAQQARVNTDLQEALMRTRMVPFSNYVPRLRRLTRQTARSLGKQVELDVSGGEGEIDRNVLERINAPLEHLIRNAISHGIESAEERKAAGKPGTGRLTIDFSRRGPEVRIRISDDGRGIDVDAIRRKAVERKLLPANSDLTDRDLQQFILVSGFSTAKEVSQISGRGVGLDVVHSEVKQLGGSLEMDSTRGQGTSFSMNLPFTVAVNRALLVGVTDEAYAVPLVNLDGVVRLGRAELEQVYAAESPLYKYGGETYHVQYLGALVGSGLPDLPESDDTLPVVLVRAGDKRIGLQVDSLQGTREIVVKSLGPQLSTVTGIAGATILGDGNVVPILEVAALTRMGTSLQQQLERAESREKEERPIKVMVVDDSITMRKVASRVLERHHMEVITAKDGVEALTVLHEQTPDVMLLDIEMPRMDGYELATHMRRDARWQQVPIIMITSRTGAKHKERAMDIGVDRYLGKPYQENELLLNIRELAESGREAGSE